mgnify:CR=1 FL=1
MADNDLPQRFAVRSKGIGGLHAADCARYPTQVNGGTETIGVTPTQ